MKPSLGLLLASAALVPTASSARPLPLYGHFAYSSLCWEKASGDAAGTRFMLSRTRTGARLDYEYGAGPLQGARIKTLKIVGDGIEATASTSDGELAITATLGPRRATLKSQFDDRKDQPAGSQTLKRIKSFRQKIPACR